MTTRETDPARQDISWNGIRFQVPLSWQPVVILNNYLLFEDNYQPVLELKWQQIKGVFSVERVVKRLRSSGSRKDSIEAQPIPLQWQHALATCNSYTFRWQGEKRYGTGLLRHCPECNLTTLLQFYMERPEDDPVCLHVLKSLRCHGEAVRRDWSIYDIAFSLPLAADLQSQEFKTGRYRISFQADSLFFSLLRYKPAAALLAGGDLKEFGSQLLRHNEQFAGLDSALQQACWRKKGNSWLRFKKRLRKKQADHFLCLRHIPEHNVILGVQAKSNQPIDETVARQILDNYQAV